MRYEKLVGFNIRFIFKFIVLILTDIKKLQHNI